MPGEGEDAFQRVIRRKGDVPALPLVTGREAADGPCRPMRKEQPMANEKRMAEVQFTTTGRIPTVEMVVPHGTRLTELTEALRVVSEKLNPQISPRGCEACTSGINLIIREQLENVVRVNLDSGELIR
jgi:hypothetical protein